MSAPRRVHSVDILNRGSKRRHNTVAEKVEIPKEIKAQYHSNYNILNLDTIIKAKIKEKMSPSGIRRLRSKLQELEEDEKNSITYIQYAECQSKIKKLKAKIDHLESGDYLNEYVKLSSPVLEQYTKGGYHTKTRVVNFMGEEEEEDEDEVKVRISVIQKYLSIAANYIKLDVVRITETQKNFCVGCNYDLTHVPAIGLENKCCPNCNTENSEVSINTYDKESSRASGSTTFVDEESVNNFMKAFTRLQGLQQNGPNSDFFEEMDDYFRKTGKPLGKDIKKLELNDKGYRGKTSPDMILDVLAKIKRTEYNEHVNYIGKHYFGWNLPNLMHLHDKLKTQYMKTQSAYLRIPEEERKRHSSLGTQFRLKMQLRLLGIYLHDEVFKIAKNGESMQNQRSLWKRMCEECNDPEIKYTEEECNNEEF